MASNSSTPLGIIDLELARTPARAADIHSAWGFEGRRTALFNILLDFPFIAAYGTFLIVLLKIVTQSFSGTLARISTAIFIAILVACFFDVIENILMIKMLKGSMGNELVGSTFMFAAVKFLLLGISALFILFSLIAKGFGRRMPVNTTSQYFN